MLDLSNLRPDPASLRTPFEGLVCGLARRFPPDQTATFSWIAGSGGDGGLEAYWTKPSGDEVGYQAKFHLSSGEVDWRKIDSSVSAALTSNPRLTGYVVALACDLTDEVPGRKGKSGRAHWKSHKVKWEADATARGMSVAFELWDLSEIEDRLTQTCAQGLRSYWLGELELTKQWFCDAFVRTATALDERYQPHDHVEVEAEETFGGLLRDERLRNRLRTGLEALRSSELEAPSGAPLTILSGIESVRSQINVIGTSDPFEVIPKDSTMPMAPTTLGERLATLQTAGRASLDAILPLYPKGDHGRDPVIDGMRRTYDKAHSSLRSVLDEAEEIKSFLSSSAVRADAARYVLTTGRAGTGKSHLLAGEVDRLTGNGIPAIMLLGSSFSDGHPLAGQIPRALGLDTTWDEFLDTMNAAAEAVGARGLVAVDAINEGGGRRWRDELAALALDVTRRPWLAFAVSCRTEYEPFLVTDGARKSAAHVVIEGFSTEEEQERAAQVYLDGRGILRPATPWLPPEFVNPLFLRTTANALRQSGRSEYPTGLHGTKEVLRFFLDVAGRHLGTEQDGSQLLVGPTALAVSSIAKEMAKARKDHLTVSETRRLANSAFASHEAPPGRSWFDVLHRRGILRLDPPAQVSPVDPLDVPEDVVRFAFQRFGDHLVAEALLDEVTPSEPEFEEAGRLSFLIERHAGRAWLSWEWSGVFQALWIAHAERNGGELVDALPRQIQGVRVDDFIETIYWRPANAFTDRTLELFNTWVVDDDDYVPARHLQVLLRLSLRDHPWNVELLDQNLRDRPLPDRDAFWTLPLALAGRYGAEHSEAHRLARWCNGPAVERASEDVLSRALTLLGWLFTTTDRALSDFATKGATHILLVRPGLLPAFIRRFAGVDDPYVLERVAAACAGACLRAPTSERLGAAAEAIYDAFFKDTPPVHLLTRDYARLIIELAHDRAVRTNDIKIERCRPPYGAKAPDWPASEEVESRIEAFGAGAILSSCAGWAGDFGRYVIKGRVEEFSTIPIKAAPPSQPVNANWSVRYDLKHQLRQNTNQACHWVADRALSLGWTSTLFPNDITISDDRHNSGRIDRIGKKYQWIALHELLARLSDNFWIFDEYRTPNFRLYNTPNDVPYVRDIEISTPPLEERSLPKAPEITVKPPEVDEVPEDVWAEWVFDRSYPVARMQEGSRTSVGSNEWYILYRYSSARIPWTAGQRAERGISTRQEEFWFEMMIGLPTGRLATSNASWKRRKVDFHDLLPDDRTDLGYLYELGRRDTWDQGRNGPERALSSGHQKFRQFTVGYLWESHLDKTMPNGLELQVPSAWLVKALELSQNSRRLGVFENADGQAVVVCQRDRGSVMCFARRGEIDALLTRERLEQTWIGFGERSTYPREGSAAKFHRRRWNAFLPASMERSAVKFWADDTSQSD